MSTQLELISSNKTALAPTADRKEPVVWLRELVVLRDLQPGEENIVRRVRLQPGLNILWAKPRTQAAPLKLREAGLSGHASGKTTFCRLIRHVLGEPNFANEDLRQRIREKLHGGWVVGEVMLAGQPWLVCRPFTVGAHPFVVRNVEIGRLFDTGLEREGLDALMSAVNAAVVGPSPVKTFASSSAAVDWDHLLPWLARDQESRFAALTDFRHPSSNSESPDLDVEDRHFLFRAILGLIDLGEQAELERNKTLVVARQAAEKGAPLLRHQANVAYERLRTALPQIEADLAGELFLDAVPRALGEEITSLDRQIHGLRESPQVREWKRKLQETSQRTALARSRRDEIKGSIELRERELRAFRGEITQKELDDWITSKGPPDGYCSQPMSRAIAHGCPLAAGRTLPIETEAAVLKIENQADELEQLLARLRGDLARQQAILDERGQQQREAETTLESAEALSNRQRDELIEARADLRNKVNLAIQVRQDFQQAAKLEASLSELDNRMRESRELQAKLREAQIRAMADLSMLYDWIIKDVLGADVEAKVEFHGRQLGLKVNHRGDLSSAAIDTVKILAFDLAALVSSAEGKGWHPRLLIHDSPREADMSADIYGRFFLFVRQLEAAFGAKSQCNFQYIVTTTEPPPEALQTAPWLIEPVLDASQAAGRILGVDL